MRYLITLFCLFVAVWAQAGSPVWKVSQGDSHLYIAGTVHLLSQQDYPLPTAFDNAYKQAEILVFETDLERLRQPSFAAQLQQQTRLADGVTIFNYLEADTAAQLRQHFKARGLPESQLAQLKAGMLSITLSLFELQRLGMAGMGVDEYFYQRAVADQKETFGLETPQHQLRFIADLGAGNEDALIRYTLDDLKRIPLSMMVLKQAWRTGDQKGLAQASLTPWVEHFPKIYRDLLVKRNQAWLPQIEQYLDSKPVELVLVGAMHLVGKDGLLAALQAGGYQIENLN